MSPSTKTGLFRVGIVLSILWVLIVAGVTLHESQDESKLCSATDMTLPQPCHQFFWTWKRPDDSAQPQKQAKEDKDQGIHIHFGKINVDVERAMPLEHHLNVEHLLLGLFGPLIAIWGIGFGIVWCAEGVAKAK